MADERENRFEGTAENVVQAGNIYGDVHFHQPRQQMPPPRQVPPATRFYTNNDRQLDDITAALRPGDVPDEEPPKVAVVKGGPGGGKSETVYEWIHRHGAHYPDGQFYASLATGTHEPGLVSEKLQGFLLAVGYPRAEIPATLELRSNLFRSWSTGKRVAVVIDDAVTAAQVRALLPGSGRSVVLVTEARSLSALRVRENAEFVPLDPLSEESARLLISRIVGKARDLTEESEAVDELLKLCHGQTTALCVVASLLADTPDKPVARLARDLSREGRRLTVLSRNEDLSVTAVFNTALARLDESTRQVYAAFGQHPGSGDVGLAALVAAVGFDEDDLRDELETLCDARLVREVSEDRYLAYDLVREHAREYFAEPEMRSRFEEFYLGGALSAGHAVQPKRGWLESLWPDLEFDGFDGDAWAWLDAERTSVRAVARSLHESGDDRLCWLAVALWPFQEQAKYVEDMDLLNRDAAEVADSHELTAAAGLAVIQRGFAFRTRGEYDKAAELFARGEDLARRAARDDLAATAVESLGIALRDQGDTGRARTALERNLEMAERLDVPRRTTLARMHLGSVAEPERAVHLLDQALAAFLEMGEGYNAAKTRMWRGKRLADLGHHDESRAELTAALEHMTAHEKPFDQAQILFFLGENANAEGDEEAAHQHCLEALSLCRTRGFAELAQRIQSRIDELG